VAHLWYVAYGSNTSSRYFTSRFDEQARAGQIWDEETWATLPHELYFAGSSRTWHGSSVAFVALEQSEEVHTHARAFLVDRDKFDAVLAAEHLWIPLEWDYDILALGVGSWCPLPTSAKYNAVLRLSDIDGVPAFTITTARLLERKLPNDDYLAICREGLASAPQLPDVDGYLSAAVERSLAGEARSVVPPPPGAPLAWRRTLVPLQSTGYPTVQLGPEESWLAAEGPVPGQVEFDGGRTDVWFLPPRDESPPGASPQVLRGLGLEEPFRPELDCRLTAAYPVSLERHPGISEDIEIADRIQVAPETALRLGRWALLVTPSLSGPVSLSPREHGRSNGARVPYATRELWEIDSATGRVRSSRSQPTARVPSLSSGESLSGYAGSSSSSWALRRCRCAPPKPWSATRGGRSYAWTQPRSTSSACGRGTR
jgi:hypothetical protein